MPLSVLNRLLDDNIRFDLAGRGTVNHLPMALLALSRLGASDERLAEFFRWWEENRALPRRDGPAIEGDWCRHIGDTAAFAALSDRFRRGIAERGADTVVAAVFPAVAPGVAAAAFHGLIRLAYGIDAGHQGEIAAGLAALVARCDDLGLDFAGTRPAAPVEAALGRLADALGAAEFAGNGISGRMQAAAADRRFRAAFSLPPLAPGLLDAVARAAIALYWQTANFTVLHMVTATHAARIVFDRFPDLADDIALRAFWGAVCAAYASVGAPPVTEAVPLSEPLPWRDIVGKAVAGNDDHVIKMTYTCRCESGRTGNPLYRAAAARLVTIGKA